MMVSGRVVLSNFNSKSLVNNGVTAGLDCCSLISTNKSFPTMFQRTPYFTYPSPKYHSFMKVEKSIPVTFSTTAMKSRPEAVESA